MSSSFPQNRRTQALWETFVRIGTLAMSETNQPSKIAFVADYLPRKCGIATFTRDLHHAVATQYPTIECGVLAINDLPEGYDYEPEVQFEIQEQRLLDYEEAANFLRFNGFDVLSLSARVRDLWRQLRRPYEVVPENRTVR